MFRVNPKDRITMAEVLVHPYLASRPILVYASVVFVVCVH